MNSLLQGITFNKNVTFFDHRSRPSHTLNGVNALFQPVEIRAGDMGQLVVEGLALGLQRQAGIDVYITKSVLVHHGQAFDGAGEIDITNTEIHS